METQKKDDVVVKKNKKLVIPVIISIIAVLAVVVAVIITLTISSSGKDRKLQEQLDLGEKYISELDYEQAIVAYEAAIEIDPMSVEAYLGLINAYIGMENYDKALECGTNGYQMTQDLRLSEQMTTIENSDEYVNCRLEKEAESLGLQVMEVGADKLTEYYAYTGGVFITTSNGLYGAMNSEGEVIVPNEYTDCEQIANDEGYFILTKDNVYYVFDRNGEIVYSAVTYSEEDNGDWILEIYYSIFVKDGYVVYQSFEGPDENYKPIVYDLSKQNELIVADYNIELDGFNLNDFCYVDIIDGYLVGYVDGLSYMGARKIEGNSVGIPVFNELHADGLGTTQLPGMGLFGGDNGACFFYIDEVYKSDNKPAWYDCCGLVPILSENGKACSINMSELAQEFHGISEEESYFPWGWYKYWTQGTNKINLDKQIVIYIGDGNDRKLYLLNFENAQTDEFGYVNPADVVIGSYDYIELNDSGNYLACNVDDWFYVNSKGEIVADYKDCSDFWNGYALIIDEDNLAYIINTEFEKVSSGYPADRVYCYGEALALEKDGETIFLMP